MTIDRGEAQRRELQAGRAVSDGSSKSSVSVLTILPRAAELLRKQIGKGLGGDPEAALSARSILRELFCGQIDLSPDVDGELWAEYGVQLAALLQVVSNRGSGGALWSHSMGVFFFSDKDLRAVGLRASR